MTRVICFDLETTGFEYAKGDRVIEIGAVEICDGKITDQTFHEYINPDGKVIPQSSYMVHKLSNEFLSDKPKFAAVAQKLLDFIGDSQVVAHNGFDFDFPFINYELTQLGLPTIPREQQQDSIVIARHKVFGPKEYTLDSLAKWFGVSLVARADAHGALIDAEILAKVYLELSAAASSESIGDIIEKQKAALAAIPKNGGNFPHRTFAPSESEIKAHTEFMEKHIKKSDG
ncbi:MAG: ribonuclease H-like domain-containing protein [Rickettsiales bacterium]|jgi:DNA polymerase-3 subunit epsilon|nr:ribonuclease H-like domain-containing protein [Rickettsiales bacterium]